MGFIKTKPTIGLDIGQGTVKVVALSGSSDTPETVECHLLDCQEEGLLSPDEILAQLKPWLEQVGLVGGEYTVGVPQYLATTQISDFPEGSGEALDEMVAFETQQLAGLSDEPFLFGYHRLPATKNHKNPVLIGICRQSVVDEQARQFRDIGIWVRDFAMNGLALANAYCHLYPEESKSSGPQLLLDIGIENTTMVVLNGGHPIFVTSLLFGSEKFNQALAQHLKGGEEIVEQAKRNARLNPADPASPLFQAAKLLEKELRTAVEHWRSQASPEIARKMFERIGLAGGGAKLTGLADFLGRTFGCESKVVGVPVEAPGEGRRDPVFMVAFGLALQGMGAAHARISLAPDSVRWMNLRRHSVGYLYTATALAILLMAGGLFYSYQALTVEKERLQARMLELDQCAQLIKQIDSLNNDIEHREKLLLPFVEKGNRARRFLAAIEKLAEARGPDDWFVYLADRDSYEAGKQKEEKPKKPTAPKPGAGSPLMGMGFGAASAGTSAADDTGLPDPYPVRIKLPYIRPVTTMIAAVYTRIQPVDPYRGVKKIIEKLNTSKDKRPLFRNVDLFPDSERAAREDIFLPWEKLLYTTRRAGGERYKAFVLRMPFAELDVHPPKPEKGKDAE
ncbi:MAG: pilus assembly protein PilM [Kiritimatiellaeota bacterium]|nr:pilus assembly protein PilM [Kiritimatiellota bacterium]